tara:strand:+ start:25 stop:387 length:363 start_codon:yes stop_codon:yes gene_type:complete
MVNASINWASLCGIILALYGIPAGILGFVQLVFILQKRADISSALILKSILLVFRSLGRLLMLPLCGGILFFQGWRLDPILQFGQFLLVLGIIFESATSILSDLIKWRNRSKKFTENIEL